MLFDLGIKQGWWAVFKADGTCRGVTNSGKVEGDHIVQVPQGTDPNDLVFDFELKKIRTRTRAEKNRPFDVPEET